MADDIISGSESVYSKQICDNLILIDPNKIESQNGQSIEDRLVRHEDLVIYVNLVARVIPRSKLIDGKGASDSGVKIDLFNGEINFLKPLNKKSLDSDWTDAFTDPSVNKIRREEDTDDKGQTFYSKSIENKSDFQGFGITGIDIKISSSFVPQVTINFTDVRGKTLFEQAETNTPYTAFFHLPYPQFELTVKGYYGKAVKYQLALTQFNATFDPNSGDYNVTGTFIGNHIAMLNDINLQQAMLAPYLYPVVSAGNSGVPNNSGIGRKVMEEVYDIYEKKKLIPKDFPRITIFELIGLVEGFTDNLKKNFSKADLRFTNDQKSYQQTLINFHSAIFGDQGWVSKFINKGEHTFPLSMTLGSTGNPDTQGKNIIAQAWRLNQIDDEYIANAESKLKYIIEGYKKILSENITFGLNGRAPINLIKDFSLENQKAVNNSSKNLSELKEGGKGWYVLETSPKSFGGVYGRVKEEFDKNYKKVQKEASDKLRTVFEQSLSFFPSIRNLMAIVIAGVDTYLRLLDRVHTKAMNERANPFRVKSVITNKKGYEDAVKGGKEVFPWPQYYQYNDNENRYVLKYPGCSGCLSETHAEKSKVWPEVEFIEEYTKAINTRVNNVSFPTSNEVRYSQEVPLSVRQFPFIEPPYVHTIKNNILWEILDRALDFTTYVGVTGFKANPTQIYDTVQEAAVNDSVNLMKAIESDYDLQEFFKDTTLDWSSLLTELKNNSPDRFLLYNTGYVNTSYLNPINTKPYDINGTSYGLYPESSTKEIFTENGKYLKYLILFLESKKTQDWWHDFYPFNMVNIDSLKTKLSDAANLTSEKFFQIDVLQMGTQTNVYMTSPNNTDNKSFYFSNLNWDLKTINGTLMKIVEGDLDYISNFKPLTDWSSWNAYYETKESNIEFQSLTDGINYTSESFDYQLVSMLNTPWFANAIYKGFINENNSTSSPYAEAAYLFLNSLPLTSTLEKIITKYEGKHQYGAYVAQVIKQLAGYHELPYAFILKIGSLWWNYKNAPNSDTSRIFGGLGSGDGGTLGNDGDIRCNEWYVDQAHANGLGWYDYTYNGNIIPGLNTTEVTLGFWPRLIDAVHTIVTGKSILPAVGSWTPVADINMMFTGIANFELVNEEKLKFHKDGQDYNFYTTFIDSSTIGSRGLDDIDVNTDPYYLLYPSSGALVNSDLSFMEDNINTAGFDGSARFLWAGAGYGAFDVTQPGTTPLTYGATYGRVPKSHYTKRIDTSQEQQQSWNINNTTTNGTDYDDFTELLSVFPTQVLDEFEKHFLNFSEPQNPDATIVEGEFTEFKTIFKEIMLVEKNSVKGDDNITRPSGNITHKTQDIAKAQYKKFLKIGKIFLNQNIVYKHGSVNGWDIVTNIATEPISTKQLISHITESNDEATVTILAPYDVSLYPTIDAPFLTSISLNVIPTLEVGDNTQFTNVSKICFDFFVNFNIDPTLVNQFAPILKQYVTETFRTSLTATNGITKADFKNRMSTFMDNIDTYTKSYMDKFFQSVKGLDPRKGLDGTGNSVGDGDDRPKIVSDNLKLELYQVFKTFNDKWISGTDVKSVDVDKPSPTSTKAVPNYNTQFEKFMFLDRTNTDIGNDAVIDIYQFLGLDTPFTENPDTSVKQNIGGFVSTLCSKNFFNFIPLPSYVNFYNIEEHDTKGQGNAMFGAFKEVDYTLSSPKYLCQYIGPPSTSLDIKSTKYGYNNDSFVLNRVSPNPLCKGIPQGEEEKNLSNKVMAFAVDFGIPNQNVFESISLDQSEFPNTSESFRILEDMGKMASGSKVSTNSLNLFNLYKSRSYKCQVTSMGNALIQPTTYFQLRYVPMFSGPYLIMDVSHSITPNDMVTTFTGVRVGIPSLPQIDDLIASIQETLIKSMDEDLDDMDVVNQESALDPFDLTPPEQENNVSDSDNISTLSFAMVDPLDISKINNPATNQEFWVWRSIYNDAGVQVGRRRHAGIDYSPKTEFQGTDIDLVSPVTGIIVTKKTGCIAGNSKTAKSCGGGYGNQLVIEKTLIESSDISSYVSGAITKYQFRMAHIKEKTITNKGVGTGVSKKSKIGVMGTTGKSDGVHLHYEIMKYQLDDNLKEQKYYLNPNQFSSDYLEQPETP